MNVLVLTIAYVTEYFLLCLEVSQERCCIFQGCFGYRCVRL